MISVYVHIPFCLEKCSYCDFFSQPVPRDGALAERYGGALIKQFSRDVRRLGLAERGVSSVYFGGGTPSLMPARFFEKTMWAIGTTFVMQSDIEVTCEVNPATADAAWFKRMVGAGINRFSVGVQSFQDEKLAALGRPHSADDAQRCIAEAQDSGASSVSVDMMYGLPGQVMGELEADLRLAMTFQPQHISAYQLTVEKGTGLADRIKNASTSLSLPKAEACLKQMRLVRRMLESGGWEAYEISNFAKPSHRCRHNLHYWRYGEYLGLGCGATSFLLSPGAGRRRANYATRWTTVRAIDDYLKGRFARVDCETISRRTAMGEYCFMGLRTAEGISLTAFKDRFKTSFRRAFPKLIEELEEEGLLACDNDRLRLTPRGIEVSNTVFSRFVE